MTSRVRLDVACNDPDNGLFAHCAEQLQVDTWDGEPIEFVASRRAPRFTEISGGIRFMRCRWPIIAREEWHGNWCWNAYWLHPEVLIRLLALTKRSRLFHCDCGPRQLYDNWNDDASLNGALWANLWGRPSIGLAA